MLSADDATNAASYMIGIRLGAPPFEVEYRNSDFTCPGTDIFHCRETCGTGIPICRHCKPI
ncbi:MAG: hypothetical protein JWM95_1215 [Gemmatimonadetes bacterium]|nr:hypothetical protein [Gemmatimonadota bacterium]